MFSSKSLNNKIQIFFYSAAILFITFAIIGGIRRYTSVPLGDMWDGYIGWYIQDHWRGLLAFHNEHRIVLARLIYWFDVALLGNTAWFLVVINYLLVACACLIFWLILKEQAGPPEDNYPRKILFLFLIAWLFAWSQRENLISGFQNQFFNAQLLPLFAFYLLYRSSMGKSKSRLTFFCSCIVGVLSCGTMANGVLALPLMTGYALLTRESWQRKLILFMLAAMVTILYFIDFHTPGQHSSLSESLLHSPLMVLEYSLLYLGSPFDVIFRHFGLSHSKFLMLITFAGCLLLISVLYFAIKYLFLSFKREHSYTYFYSQTYFNANLKRQLMLLMFIFFIIATAVGTAGGRIIFGFNSALASRYVTPAITAWSALFILYFPFINSVFKKCGNIVWLPFVIILLALLPDEWTALKNKNEFSFNSHLAVLALELHVPDQEIIDPVMYMDRAFARLEQADKKNFVLAGMEKIKGIRQQMGQIQPKNIAINLCLGQIDTATIINKDPHFVRISGWIKPVSKNKWYQPIQFLDITHRVIGFGITGKPRTDISQTNHRIGFEGYVQNYAGQQIIITGDKLNC